MTDLDKDLVERKGLYYKKFSDVPFSGKVTGLNKGLIENGKEEGEWIAYYDNGQLSYKGNYENGKEEGEWIAYYDNGQLDSKGNYKNGKKEGEWIAYWDNGQLDSKGNYKNGWVEDVWVSYEKDGTLFKNYSGTFMRGVKISD